MSRLMTKQTKWHVPRFIRVREMSGKFNFFSRSGNCQGIFWSVRETWNIVRISGNFTFQSCKSLDVWAWWLGVHFMLNFWHQYCQVNLNLCQGNVREFCSILWVGTLMCAHRRLRSAWATVFAVCLKKAWVLSYPLSGQRRLSSDWADGQADLSLCWAHSHFVGFVMRWLK